MPVALAFVLALAFAASSARADSVSRGSSPQPRDRVTCSIAAALKFRVPTNIMLAIAEMEGGRPGQQVRNRNGSLDVGPMQFNTRYLEHLEQRYGITPADVAATGCYPYDLAAWRVRKHLQLDTGDTWTRAANYHSRSPAENVKYRRTLIAKAATWTRWLSARFPTSESRVARVATRAADDLSGVQRTSKLHTDTAGELAAELGENTADIESLVRLLNGEDDAQRSVPRDLRSDGSSQGPSLHGGVQLPAHRGYVVRDPSRSWGTVDTIERLTDAFDEVLQADPLAPRVRVHDLSLENGGPMRDHRSHQTGRDVDITYYQRSCKSECVGGRVAPSELDAAREWRLLRSWLQRGAAEFIFVDYALQRPLYEQAKSAGATPRELAQWFQYPRGRTSHTGVIRHVPNHANHVHIRFQCAQRAHAARRPHLEMPKD